MKGCFSNIMGANASVALMKEIGSDQFPPNERYFGLHNFGNTCYCNSVLQALFFCPPFREQVLQYRLEHSGKHSNGKKDSLLTCLCDLFYSIANQKKRCGVLQPKKFVARLRKEHESFDNYMQHDAHELFNLLLNSIHIVLLEEKEAEREKKRLLEQKAASSSGSKKERSSFFRRNKKDKSINKLQANGGTKTLIITESNGLFKAKVNGTESAPSSDRSESMSSIDSPSLTDENTLNLNELIDEHRSKQKITEIDKNLNESNNDDNPPVVKPSGFSFLSRMRASKKLSSSSRSSDVYNAASRENIDEEEEEDTNTWIHDIFQGTYTTITRCLTCETVKNKDEDFLDLSVEIEQNTSITHCLRVFSNQQMLNGEHKYSCEVCRSKQEAQIQMRIKKLPNILALHLKRFKYCDTLNKYTKLTYRVVFPFELRLFNTTDDASNPERLYDLIAVVVHCGSGPYRGHYVSIVKSHGMWLLFDDDNVEKLEPSGMEDFYGVTANKNSESGYILFYQSKDG